MDAASCWVYVLRCSRTGRYYVGSAEDVPARLRDHNRGHVRSTRAFGPWEVAYQEWHPSRALASRRERQIKGQKSRRWIEWHLLGQAGAQGAQSAQSAQSAETDVGL